jgi:hypothetical protein
LRQAGKMKHQQMKRLQTPNCEVATENRLWPVFLCPNLQGLGSKGYAATGLLLRSP